MKTTVKPREQLVKCTPEILQQCFQVFNQGRSYFPELHTKNIFSMIMILLLQKINSSLRKIMSFNGEIFQENLQQEFGLLTSLLSQLHDYSAIPMDKCHK
jgi:hypothetical protein